MKLPNLTITHAGEWHSPASVKVSHPRFVQRYELECFVEDGGTSFIDGVGYPLQKNCLIFRRPGVLCYSAFPLKTAYIHFHMDDVPSEFAAWFSRVPVYCPPSESVAAAFHRVVTLFCEKSAPSAYNTLLALLYTLSLLEEKRPQKSNGSAAPTIIPHRQELYDTISYMQKNLHRSLTVAELADVAGFSESHFSVIFRQAFNATPIAYLTALRIREAKHLLRMGIYSMSEIAEKTGFCSTAYFGLVFRRQTGEAPGAFAKNNRPPDYEMI